MPDIDRRSRHTRGLRCPHCRGRVIVRTARELSPLFRELTCQCTNPACSHSYVVGMEVLRTICPSAMPNPDVCIPESHHAGAFKGAAQA